MLWFAQWTGGRGPGMAIGIVASIFAFLVVAHSVMAKLPLGAQ